MTNLSYHATFERALRNEPVSTVPPQQSMPPLVITKDGQPSVWIPALGWRSVRP